MFKRIDAFLNQITMYKLVLYALIALLVVAVAFSFAHLLPFNPFALAFSSLFFVAVCWIVNAIGAWAFDAPANVESLYITALILALIISPPSGPFDTAYFSLAVWASVWAMASKFIFAIRMKHIFNPAAFAVALTSLALNRSASWWTGTAIMLPFVLVSGWLIVRKIRRADLVWSFFVLALVTSVIFGIARGASATTVITKTVLDTALFFFAFVMLTEPLTTPPTRGSRILYGAFVGFLFAPDVHIGSFYFTPELALLAGNIFSYLISPKEKLLLVLDRVETVADQTYDFVFRSKRRASFKPGQYMEWTIPQKNADSRGNRRYFTIASSPTEQEVRMGVKFYPKPSSFKKQLAAMKKGDVIVVSQLSGEFVLPNDTQKKLAFIAGGIGVTPFRSMVKYLSDIQEKRDITLFYCTKTTSEIAYSDIFDRAAENIGLRTVNVLSDAASAPKGWQGRTGFLDEKIISEETPDFKERVFYISGPHAMVTAFENTLNKMGVPRSHIKTDYFPGFA